ncbi:MAG: hypothetical protein AAGF49_06710 [Pseudomonadota bacterium]
MAKKDELLPFLLKHALIGGAGACGAVALMLWADFANLRTLVVASDVGVLAVAVMTVFFVITFASVQMGFALMLAAEKDEGDDGTARAPVIAPVLAAMAARFTAPASAPAPVRATATEPAKLRSTKPVSSTLRF